MQHISIAKPLQVVSIRGVLPYIPVPNSETYFLSRIKIILGFIFRDILFLLIYEIMFLWPGSNDKRHLIKAGEQHISTFIIIVL